MSTAIPKVGETAPDFVLPDIDGKQWTRAELMGPRGLVVHFVREFS